MTSQHPAEFAESPQDASTQSAAPEAGSANPDHQGGKVESNPQPETDGAVAPTDDEKGGSSE